METSTVLRGNGKTDNVELAVWDSLELADWSTTTSVGPRQGSVDLEDLYATALREQAAVGTDSYGGVPADGKDMRRLGKKQEMKRVYKQFSLISFTAIFMSTWEFLLLSNTQGLTNGGSAGLFWSYVWTCAGYGFIIASMAEMSSMAPTCGGQYHWVSEFGPPRWQRMLSYVEGWLSTLCWQANNASGTFLVAEMIQSLISMYDGNYAAPSCHTTLLVLAIQAVCIVGNLWGAHYLPMLQNATMVVHVCGFVAVVVAMWVFSPHVGAKTALLEFSNGGGWSTTGLSLMMGQISAVYCLSCPDSAAHMAEEVRDAGIAVPKAMMWTFIGNGLMGFLVLITFVFCLPSVDDAVNDPSGFSILYIWDLSFSRGVTAYLFILLLILIMVGNVSCVGATARQAFAFARDRGLPYSSFLGRIHPSLKVPANAIFVSALVTALLSLINIGNSSAYNAIISLTTVGQLGPYIISIGCILHRRLTAPHLLPEARWSLGRFGIPINAAGMAYACFAFFWMFWPSETPVHVDNMNWAPVVFAATILAGYLYYVVQGHKDYFGPVSTIKYR